jgi:hypothetical protein
MIIRDVVEEEKMVNSVANFEHRCIEFICEYHGHLYSRDHSCGRQRPTANVKTCIGISNIS